MKMKEIDYMDREALRVYVGKPALITKKAYYGTSKREPSDVTLGILREINKSFWIEGPILKVKRDIKWDKVYKVMGVDYIPWIPRVVHPILDHHYDPDYKLYSFDSEVEGMETIEKIKRLEDIVQIL